jgi:hypothetical protein
MHFLLFLEGYISAFWDLNLEIRIGSKGSVGQAHGVRWGWEQGLCKVQPPSPTPGTSYPVCPGLSLWPVTPPLVYKHLHVFIFPLIPFRGGGSGQQSPQCVAGGFGCARGPLYGLP